MEWLEQHMEQYREAVHERDEIKQHAPEIYERIWTAIVEVVTSDSLRGLDLKYNGFPLKHTVTLGNRKVTIALDEDKCGVTAQISDGTSVELKLRFCGDTKAGGVCIMHDGSEVGYSAAARKIMEPFLFEGDSSYALKTLGH